MDIGTIAYCLNVILSAIMAGFMISYAVTLGGYFSYMVQNGKSQELQQTYAPFRTIKKAKARYGLWVMAQLAVAVISLVYNYGHSVLPQIFAVAVLPAYYTFHRLVGFGKIEEKLNGGSAALTQQETHKYLKLNVPLHWVYAVLYTLAASWLLFAVS